MDANKYNDKNPADYNVLDISRARGSRPTEKYFCSYCNRSLFVKNKEDQEYICTFCNILYYPNQQPVKKASTFELPGPATDSHGNVIGDSGPIIAMGEDPNKQVSSTLYRKPKLSKSFEALEKAGFHFTGYSEK